MAISDTIQSMYENVGEVYDTITNVTLPEHKNIENIPSTIRDSYLEIMNNGIDVIWDNWEKVVGEGTELTLSNTEQAPMKVLLKGNTYQDSTSISGGDAYDSPTPEYPQEVQVVSGDNEVEVVGKNLFDENTILTNGGMTYSSGYYTGAVNTLRAYMNANHDLIKFEKNTQYTISLKGYNGTATNTRVRFTYTNGTYSETPSITSTTETTTSRTSDANKTIEYISFNYGQVGTISIKEMQLEKGNQATDYIPYQSTTYPINLPEGMFLGSIGNYQDRFFKTSGKNLLETDTISYSQSGTYNLTLGNDIEVGTYSFSGITNATSGAFVLYGIDENNTQETLLANKNWNTISTGYNFTTTKKYVSLKIYTNASATGFIMLNKGNQPLPYEPYGTNEWYLEKKIGKVVLNGSEEGWINDGGGAPYRISIYNASVFKSASEPPLCYTDKFLPVSYNSNWNNYNSMVSTASSTTTENGKKLKFRFTDISSLEDFKTWLSTHNTTVYYVLATPTYTKIEGTLASQLEAVYRAKSEEGQTNISQTNDDLPFVLNVSALKVV